MISPVLAIVKKDIRSLMTSPMFYLLTGFCSVVWSLFFAIQVYSFVQQSYQLSTRVADSGLNIHQGLISSYLVVVHYVLVFIIAALSMRFFAEEKKLKTFPILLTSPMTSWQIVLAKWLGGVLTLLFLLLVSAIFPLSLAFFIEIPWGLVLFSYFGLFMVVCIYLGVAMLASSLTESLIVSVTMTLVVTLFLMLLGVGRELTDISALQDFFSFLALDPHFANFRKGLFSLSSILYFASWSVVLLFLTERTVEYRRWR